MDLSSFGSNNQSFGTDLSSRFSSESACRNVTILGVRGDIEEVSCGNLAVTHGNAAALPLLEDP